ncbi:hypothetical protein FM105_08280 [Brevibacterium yomogidense]|uniref:Uncharacterized protein n=1 Tax=Brevibacterium yomogidense TaxID=946573 RepID=A0A1X6XHV7_9MICO|nr:hypothetical protein FM105_08280 [Brevibacterium yomogidense]
MLHTTCVSASRAGTPEGTCRSGPYAWVHARVSRRSDPHPSALHGGSSPVAVAD